MPGKWCENCRKTNHNTADCWGPGTVALPPSEPAWFGAPVRLPMPAARPWAEVHIELTAEQEAALRRKWRNARTIQKDTRNRRHIKHRDACQNCAGERGGVRGNENVIDGRVLCDYCSVDPLVTKQRAGS